MATDRALTSVLRAYQTVHNTEQTNRVLSTTTHLLTALSNPLNITLLTSQLLIAPAIWNGSNDSRTFLRIISIYNTAAIRVRQHEFGGPQQDPRGGIKCDDWARAVVKGADEKSPRWRHLLVIGGILMGMEGQDRQGLSRNLRTILEEAMLTAANMALEDNIREGELGSAAIALTLSHTFDLLSDNVKRRLNYDVLAHIAIHSIIGPEGYQEGYFLGAADVDIRRGPGNRFDWSPKSPTFVQLQEVASKPLISAIGPLSRLAAHSLANMANPLHIPDLMDDIAIFSRMLSNQWRRNKLSELDPSEETKFLTPETTEITFPLMWQVLKTVMFAIVNILRAITSRSLVDNILIAEVSAQTIASKVLHILRHIYFISSRLGTNSLSAYTFSFLTSIDILSRFPDESRLFLLEIRTTQPGQIPAHPLDRNFDLFSLNVCEHFPLVLSPQDNEDLIVTAASPYLDPGAHRNLMEIFEAAHSVMLAVLAAPQNASLTIKLIPFYVETLFRSFPTNLSPRQFRFAFKTLIQITTPPSSLSASEPLLADTLVELLYHRAVHAPTSPLPSVLVFKSDADAQLKDKQPPLSEQAVIMLALLDSLPFLPCRSLDDWLSLAADLLNLIKSESMREFCKARFWEVLESGEMDVDRAAVCVAWWTTRGGREKVLFGQERPDIANGPYMSGALLSRAGSGLL